MKEKNKSVRKDERGFYREMNGAQLQDKVIEVPQVEDMADYWSGIWGKTNKRNFEVTWLKLEEQRIPSACKARKSTDRSWRRQGTCGSPESSIIKYLPHIPLLL